MTMLVYINHHYDRLLSTLNVVGYFGTMWYMLLLNFMIKIDTLYDNELPYQRSDLIELANMEMNLIYIIKVPILL